MDNIQRWDVPVHPEGWSEECDSGEWVLYDDHIAALAEALAEIARLEAASDSIARNTEDGMDEADNFTVILTASEMRRMRQHGLGLLIEEGDDTMRVVVTSKGNRPNVRLFWQDDAAALSEAQATIARLEAALRWIENRKPKDVRSDGSIGQNSVEHGQAAHDMWACARAALSPVAPDQGEG